MQPHRSQPIRLRILKIAELAPIPMAKDAGQRT
jgi:hypothetical protein